MERLLKNNIMDDVITHIAKAALCGLLPDVMRWDEKHGPTQEQIDAFDILFPPSEVDAEIKLLESPRMETPSMIRTLEHAYLALIQMPICSWRIKNQSVYCNLRDAIADYHGMSCQDIQEKFEDLAQ